MAKARRRQGKAGGEGAARLSQQGEPEDEGGEAQAGKRKAGLVERRRVRLHDVGDEVPGQDKPERADGQIDVEDPPPMQIGRDEAAKRRPDHRPDQRRDGEPRKAEIISDLATLLRMTRRPTGTIMAPPRP